MAVHDPDIEKLVVLIGGAAVFIYFIDELSDTHIYRIAKDATEDGRPLVSSH
jgi:hypothetical protein